MPLHEERVNMLVEVIEALKTIAQHGHLTDERSALIDVGTTKYINFFEEEILDTFISQGGATCRFYEGPSGSGKSHLLSLLYHLGIKKGYIIYRTALSDDLPLDDWQGITKEILANMEMVIGSQHIQSLPNILKELSKNPQYQIDKLGKTPLPHEGIRKAMIYAMKHSQGLDETQWEVLSRYILGEKTTAKDFRSVNFTSILKGSLTKRNAEVFLKTVLTSLHMIGVPGLLLLFDENNKTLTTSPTRPSHKFKKAANLIRRLIDGTTNGTLVGTGVVFAVLPGFFKHVNDTYPALGQRLMMNRNVAEGIGWRSPVLPIQSVNETESPEEFLRGMVELLLRYFQVRESMKEELYRLGEEVLEAHAGADYRRALIKRLATHLIANIESIR